MNRFRNIYRRICVAALEKDKDEVKTQIMFQIQKYLPDNRLRVDGMDENGLADKLYTEMAEYSFLTKYIFGKGIEEININAWNDIEVYYSGGRKEKLDEHFESPQHAVNVVRRMLHASGMVLDNAAPAVLGSLTKNIRIAVLKSPLVDDDAGVSASIRIVNPMNFSKQDLIDYKRQRNLCLIFFHSSYATASVRSTGDRQRKNKSLQGGCSPHIPMTKECLP